MALAIPTMRGNQNEAPESQESAIPAKARFMPPSATMMRKSAAKAKATPAPAAMTLMAAMTGLSMVASTVAMGL